MHSVKIVKLSMKNGLSYRLSYSCHSCHIQVVDFYEFCYQLLSKQNRDRRLWACVGHADEWRAARKLKTLGSQAALSQQNGQRRQGVQRELRQRLYSNRSKTESKQCMDLIWARACAHVCVFCVYTLKRSCWDRPGGRSCTQKSDRQAKVKLRPSSSTLEIVFESTATKVQNKSNHPTWHQIDQQRWTWGQGSSCQDALSWVFEDFIYLLWQMESCSAFCQNTASNVMRRWS